MSENQLSELGQLIKMANQIADNAGDGRDVAAVTNHINRNWARSMKASIIKHLQQGGEGLNPIAKRAVEQIVTA